MWIELTEQQNSKEDVEKNTVYEIKFLTCRIHKKSFSFHSIYIRDEFYSVNRINVMNKRKWKWKKVRKMLIVLHAQLSLFACMIHFNAASACKTIEMG